MLSNTLNTISNICRLFTPKNPFIPKHLELNKSYTLCDDSFIVYESNLDLNFHAYHNLIVIPLEIQEHTIYRHLYNFINIYTIYARCSDVKCS